MAYQPPVGILVAPPGTSRIASGDSIGLLRPNELTDVDSWAQKVTSPSLVPVGIVRTDKPDSNPTFKQFFDVWMTPEINRRVENGAALDSLVPIRAALVVFPPLTAPERFRVLLNEEVQFGAAIHPTYRGSTSAFSVGDEVSLSLRNMFDLRELEFFGVDMREDGFAWFRSEGPQWALYFNFVPGAALPTTAPNGAALSTATTEERQRVMASVRDAIAQEILRGFARGVFTDDRAVRDAMIADGWCPTPILLPDPWRGMCTAFARGDGASAESLAIAAVGERDLDMMLESWVAEEPFASDRPFLERGVKHYKDGDYISAVSVLLPRIEGLANRVRVKRGVGARDNIGQVFASLEALASADVRDGFVASRIRDEFASLVTGFLMMRFTPSDPGAAGKIGRHAHAHGASGDQKYDQGYALKVILAIDALHFVAR